MIPSPLARLRRTAGLGAALVLTGALAAHANSVRVPNGGTPEGALPCAAGNPNTARFSQNCGALVTLASGDTTPSYVQDNTPNSETAYRVRFYVNLRLLQMPDGGGFDLFNAYNGADPTPPNTNGVPVLRLAVEQVSGQKQLTAFARLNSGNEVEIASPVPLPPGWHSIEINWVNGAGTGHLDLWVDGRAKTGLTSLSNDTLTINYSRWGAVAGLASGYSGSFRLDDFASQRSGYIGPALPFSDNPTSGSFFPFIQGIYADEVMPDCGVGSFCPNNPITRKEMAKFLLLARWGPSYTPPACVTATFTDVPCSNPYAAWVYELKKEGITGGCTASTFCPDGNITRAEMSVFLMVAKGQTGIACPPSPFNDIDSASTFCPWIKRITTLGITAGCGNGNFCPNDLVLRGQMSVFLSTTFGLTTQAVGP